MPKSTKRTKTLKNNTTFSRTHFILYILIFAAVGAFTLWVSLAAPARKSTVSTIDISTVNGASYSSVTSPKLNDILTFSTTVEPLAGWEYPMIALTCYQDVNGDGEITTTILGPDIVFSWLDRPNAAYTLGGYNSIWKIRGGGPATCRADLDAYGWKGGKQSVRVLSTTGDWQVGG